MDTVTTHTVEDIVETIAFFDDWEDRYRYIIDLGKELPAMPDSRKREELLVRGCQSQVWLVVAESDDPERIVFEADSDAHIVAAHRARSSTSTSRAISDDSTC